MLLTFIVIAMVLSISAAALVIRPLLRGTDSTPSAAVTIAVALPCAVLLGYLVSTNFDWREPDLAAAGVTLPPGSMEEALAAMEARLLNNPADIPGWLQLGNAYTSVGRFADAGMAYQRVLQITDGDNVEARLGLAEAMLLADRDGLIDQAAELIEQALQQEPANPKGLWYGGLVAMSRNQDALAIQRWEALLALSPPAEVRAVLERELSLLRSQEGLAALPSAAGRVGIRVSIDSAVAERVQAGARLFVFVREGGSEAGPPLAAVRHDASALPAEIWVSEADVMLPGRTLNGLEYAQVVARVANDGDATAKPGDLFGQVSWSASEAAGQPVELIINQVYQP